MLREYLILEVATQRLEGKNARQGRMAGAEKMLSFLTHMSHTAIFHHRK